MAASRPDNGPLNVKLPPQARPIQRYMDEVFSRPSFQASLTEFEQEIRQ